MPSTAIHIRPAVESDVPLILAFIRSIGESPSHDLLFSGPAAR